MFKAKCPLCNGIYKAKPDWIGKQAPCPHCHQKIIIQTAETEPASPIESISSDSVDKIKSTKADTSIIVTHSVPVQTNSHKNDDNLNSKTQPNTIHPNNNNNPSVITGKQLSSNILIIKILSFVKSLSQFILVLSMVFLFFGALFFIFYKIGVFLDQNEFVGNLTSSIGTFFENITSSIGTFFEQNKFINKCTSFTLHFISNFLDCYGHILWGMLNIFFFLLFLHYCIKALNNVDFCLRVTSCVSLSETIKVGLINIGINIVYIIAIIINRKNTTIIKLSNIEIISLISYSLFSVIFLVSLIFPWLIYLIFLFIFHLLRRTVKINVNPQLPLSYYNSFFLVESTFFTIITMTINSLILIKFIYFFKIQYQY